VQQLRCCVCCTAVTPPRIASGDPTLPLQGGGRTSAYPPMAAAMLWCRRFQPWRFSDAGRMSASRARLAGVRKPAQFQTFGWNLSIEETSETKHGRVIILGNVD